MMTTSMGGQILQTKGRKKKKISRNSGLDGVLNED